MGTPRNDICAELDVDLCLALLELVAARERLRSADTPGNRAAAARCRARLDVVLDLLRELEDDPPARKVRVQPPLEAPGRPRRT